VWTIAAPTSGVVKKFFATSTSTLTRQLKLASGNFEVGVSVGGGSGSVTAGSSYTTITLNGLGQSVTCIGRSTAVFCVVHSGGFSTATAPYSTV
jgi:hypothetical protein